MLRKTLNKTISKEDENNLAHVFRRYKNSIRSLLFLQAYSCSVEGLCKTSIQKQE